MSFNKQQSKSTSYSFLKGFHQRWKKSCLLSDINLPKLNIKQKAHWEEEEFFGHLGKIHSEKINIHICTLKLPYKTNPLFWFDVIWLYNFGSISMFLR